MNPIGRMPFFSSAGFLALVSLAAGVAGMAKSFAYLASADQLDVLAGAAGFVAGSVLVAAGLVAVAILSPRGAAAGARPAGSLLSFLPPVFVRR